MYVNEGVTGAARGTVLRIRAGSRRLFTKHISDLHIRITVRVRIGDVYRMIRRSIDEQRKGKRKKEREREIWSKHTAHRIIRDESLAKFERDRTRRGRRRGPRSYFPSD